jgi:hypothetical protein
MHGYASADRPGWLPVALLAGLLAALAACGEPAESGRFEITRVDARWSNGSLSGSCELGLTLGPEAREALRHGVALTVELELILRSTDDQTRVGQELVRHEIRYLPLSEHYQVSGLETGHAATFPRLRHALAELSRIDFRIDTGALPAGAYEVLARSRLDRRSLPPPMRLPALFDRGWMHTSGWSSWPLTVDSGV